jgi:hypothetical protein
VVAFSCTRLFPVLLVAMLEDVVFSRLQRGAGTRQICETDRIGT